MRESLWRTTVKLFINIVNVAEIDKGNTTKDLVILDDNTLNLRTERAGNVFYSEGFHTVIWNATDEAGSRVTSSMYVYVLRAGETVLQNKMFLMK